MSVTLATTTIVTSQPTFASADETNLSVIADHLKNDNLRGALDLCETIQGIYNKNMAYLLVSFWYLGHLHIGLAKDTLARVHPTSAFDRHQCAKTSIEQIIRFVESSCQMGWSPALDEGVINDEFHFHTALIRQAAERCVKTINDAEPVDREARAGQQQEKETSYQFSIDSSKDSSDSWRGPYLAFNSADSNTSTDSGTSTDSDTSNGVVWIEPNSIDH